MRGKKLPQLIEQTLASFPQRQPLRLMFQDEARFGMGHLGLLVSLR
jgi:hypothetical protein